MAISPPNVLQMSRNMSYIHNFKVTVLENKALLLYFDDTSTKIIFLGSTMKVSAENEGEESHQLTIYPEVGKEGVIALGISLAGGTHTSSFFKVIWKQKGDVTHPFIIADQPWSSPFRIGRITIDGVIVRLSNGKRSLSFEEISKTGYRVSGNLLCRYLFGTAHAADLLHEVVQRKTEASAPHLLKKAIRYINILENKNRALNQKLELLRKSG